MKFKKINIDLLISSIPPTLELLIIFLNRSSTINSIKLVETNKNIEMNTQIIIDTLNKTFWINSIFSFLIAISISFLIFYLLRYKRKIKLEFSNYKKMAESEFLNYKEYEYDKWNKYLQKQKQFLDEVAFENYKMNSDNMDLLCKSIGINYQESAMGKTVSNNFDANQEKITEFFNELNRDNKSVS